MFNLSGSEIIVILILALVVLGPEKLPEAMRKAGRTFAELKKMSSGFQDEIRKGFEEPSKEVKKTAAAVRSAATFTGANTAGVKDKPRYNPAADARPELPEGSSVAEPIADEAPVVDVNGSGDPVVARADPAPPVDGVESASNAEQVEVEAGGSHSVVDGADAPADAGPAAGDGANADGGISATEADNHE